MPPGTDLSPFTPHTARRRRVLPVPVGRLTVGAVPDAMHRRHADAYRRDRTAEARSGARVHADRPARRHRHHRTTAPLVRDTSHRTRGAVLEVSRGLKAKERPMSRRTRIGTFMIAIAATLFVAA